MYGTAQKQRGKYNSNNEQEAKAAGGVVTVRINERTHYTRQHIDTVYTLAIRHNI